MFIGLANDLVSQCRRRFTPKKLFTGTTTGVWYDPSDITTLYQDSAGTTPVTAIEQPVGLMLDKSKSLVLGSELVTNGDFSAGTTGWFGTAATISVASGELEVNGSATGGRAVTGVSFVAGRHYRITGYVRQGTSTNPTIVAASAGAANSLAFTPVGNAVSGVFIPAASGVGEIWLRSNTGTAYFDNISVRELPGNHAFQATSANRPTLSARYNLYVGTESLATQNVTTVASNYKLTFSGSGSITLSGTATGVYTAGSYTITCTAGTLTSTVSGAVTQADLRVANDALNQPAYQRVNTSTDYDTVGFKPYMSFNGTSSSMSTNSIDFSYGDKMFVSAGVRKLSDAATAVFAETSVDAGLNAGAFYVAAPGSVSPNIAFWSRGVGGGATASYTNTAVAAPITNVLSGIGNISAPNAALRINGTQVTQSTASQGTGNYGNYPLYIGARAGSSLFFNGRLHQLVIAGKAASASEITNTETYVNQKTGAY